MRILVNAVIVILILLSRLIIRRRKRVIDFNVNTGVAEYKTTYYFLLFIPVFWKRQRTPRILNIHEKENKKTDKIRQRKELDNG